MELVWRAGRSGEGLLMPLAALCGAPVQRGMGSKQGARLAVVILIIAAIRNGHLKASSAFGFKVEDLYFRGEKRRASF